jgi:hypothetical protein
MASANSDWDISDPVPDKPVVNRAERLLWSAVVLMAVRDVEQGDAWARRWFEPGGTFDWLCGYIGLALPVEKLREHVATVPRREGRGAN